jgi:hypothetical protein
MANVQYADPFGSYVKGAQAGQEATINEGMAARRFRAADLSPEVQAWYLPLKQREAAATTGQGELTLNNGLLDTTGKLAALGAPGRNAFYGVANNMLPGANLSDANFANPQQAFSQIGEASGNVPYSFGIPNVTSSGHYGTVRDITPTYGGQNNPAAAAFDPWGASTGHLNLGGGITKDSTAPQTAPAPTQPNPAGGVNSQYMIHPGNVPGYSNPASQSGAGGLPTIPGDRMMQ